ncbi:unnamed protein product [Caenorhabditis auriculariae]|uniref:C2 domain-containing protein n=1 Tax=Caenorhabditis auriculariae TaxID=2777116 RepID=A0A8S1GNH8_9PELO|nr:unnamed protein product [Caenorhabditis auriculariae]
MLIPVCCERLPVRLEVSIVSAKALPVMNKSINSTDAFVEVRFLEEVEKTEVVTSLNPVWDSEFFVFETDEKDITEEWLQFRVMDHDTYSANDAIGRVSLDCNVLIERMRMTKVDLIDEHIALKIYDTIYGIRGELTINIRIHLLMHTDFTNYVQVFSGSNIPSHLRFAEIVGLVDNIRCEKDPDYEWLDRIRTPRATNEARQAAIRETLREAIIGLAHKADKAGANIILGFQEHVDMEGSCSDLLTCRVLGTAVRAVSDTFKLLPYAKPQKPILTMDRLPMDRQIGIGSLVTTRTVQVLGEDEDAETVRKGYWSTMRAELYQQARSIGCNVIIAYTEKFAVNEGIALLSCSGTAVNLSVGTSLLQFPAFSSSMDSNSRNSPVSHIREVSEKEIKDKKALFKFQLQDTRGRSDSTPRNFRCAQFHSPIEGSRFPMATKLAQCACCKNGQVAEFILSTTPCPPPQYYAGPRNFVQVSVCKKLTSDTSDPSEYAAEVGNALPYADHELIGNLMSEAKSIYPLGNAIFNAQCTNSMCDDMLVCVLTGVLVRLLVAPKNEAASPSISNVLSFSNLQKQHDARRFSWGTVRDAIRFKPSVQTTVTLKILNLKQSFPSAEDSFAAAKSRLRLNTFVDKVRRKQQKEYVSHVVFERHLSLCIGIHEPQTASNSSSIAGVHLSSSLHPQFVNRDYMDNHVAISRFSDVYVREDLTTAVKDSTSVDGFVTNALEERVASVKAFSSLGQVPDVSGFYCYKLLALIDVGSESHIIPPNTSTGTKKKHLHWHLMARQI